MLTSPAVCCGIEVVSLSRCWYHWIATSSCGGARKRMALAKPRCSRAGVNATTGRASSSSKLLSSQPRACCTRAGLEAWGHDLVTLDARLREQLGDAWPVVLCEHAARLSRHYIATRYPDAHASGTPGDHYTESDATQAHDDAVAVLRAVDGAWSEMQEERT